MSNPPHKTVPPLPEPERLARFRLARTENVGPVTFRQLLHRYGSAEQALEALPALARRGGRAGNLRIATAEDVAREREDAAKLGAHDLHLGCAGYPLPLASIDDAPPFLYVLGDPSLLLNDCVGMVGGRNASIAGKGFARRLAEDFGRAGLTVASGMARGIDTAAHEGSLKTGSIAVLAGGVDVVFPPENEALYRALCGNDEACGAVISEMPPGKQPLARHFPRRNRIISGLSLAVVVIEAKRKSGSLITARRAAEQGRPVYAVPSAPMDVRGAGCNDLIRDGATLLQCADDLLLDLGPALAAGAGRDRQGGFAEPEPMTATEPIPEQGPEQVPEPDASDLDLARAAIEQGLSSVPLPIDSLVRELRLPAPLVNAALLELELAGKISRQPGGFISR